MIRGRIAALVGIVLVALSLRTAVASLSPIASQVSHTLPLTAVTLSIIGAAPPIVFALAGFFVPRLVARIGLDAGLLLASVAMAAGLLLRALAPNVVVLVAATVIALIGAGIGNILLPPAVKRYFPGLVGPLTAAYGVLLSVGTALPALAAVPVAVAFGWRASLAVWFLIAAVAAVPWIVMTVRARRAAAADSPAVEAEPALEGRMARSSAAWALASVFALSSANVYAMFAWLPRLLVDTAHVNEGQAGALLSLYGFIGLPGALLIPLIAKHVRPAGLLIGIAVAAFVMSDLGLILAPAAAPILWIAVSGVGQVLFPFSLLLINDRTRTHAGSVALSGFTQATGYTIGAVSPIVFGVLGQSLGWSASLWFLLVITLGAVPAGIVLSRRRFVEDQLARR